MCKVTLPASVVRVRPSDEDGDANKLKWIKTPRTRLPNAKSRIKSDTMKSFKFCRSFKVSRLNKTHVNLVQLLPV